MSCNCKANEQILKIQRNYGRQVNLSIGERLRFTVMETIKYIIISFLLLIAFPFILIAVVVMNATGYGRINLNAIRKRFSKKNRK